jgi:ribosomal protein S18 acetylase RimI-like enzyme
VSEFAEYAPRRAAAVPRGHAPAIRSATGADLDRLAAIRAAREGEEPAKSRAVFERALARGDDSLLLVAEIDDDVAGYGRAGRFAPPPDAPSNCAPEGWYLTGVVVAPPHRRRGVGLALTTARLAWIGERADTAWYFANPRNRATIDLHARLGFVEVTRDFWFPGVTFAGGTGVLFRRRA